MNPQGDKTQRKAHDFVDMLVVATESQTNKGNYPKRIL